MEWGSKTPFNGFLIVFICNVVVFYPDSLFPGFPHVFFQDRYLEIWELLKIEKRPVNLF